MCGRYALTTPSDVLAKLFKATLTSDGVIEIVPRYNIAPTQSAPVVRKRRSVDERAIEMLHWGLVPFWSDGPGSGASMINARSETAAERPAFRHAMARRRCLVPADGFFEWKKIGRGRQPYFIHDADCGVLALAGLWEQWGNDEGERLRSFTILTTDANGAVRPLHDRMPVVIEPDDFERWLDPELQDVDAIKPLLRPVDDDRLAMYPVSTLVNKPEHDEASILEPVPEMVEPPPPEPKPDDQLRLF